MLSPFFSVGSLVEATSSQGPWLTFSSSLLPTEGICTYLDIYFRSEEVDNLTAYFNVSKILLSKEFFIYRVWCKLPSDWALWDVRGDLAYPKAKNKGFLLLFHWHKSLSSLKFFLQMVSMTAEARGKKKDCIANNGNSDILRVLWGPLIHLSWGWWERRCDSEPGRAKNKEFLGMCLLYSSFAVMTSKTVCREQRRNQGQKNPQNDKWPQSCWVASQHSLGLKTSNTFTQPQVERWKHFISSFPGDF